MSTEPTHVPEALYSCAYRACAEENSFPAEHLHWAGDKWLCFSCCAHDGVTKGISLADYLATRAQPAADLAGYPVDVVGRVAIELDAEAQETAKKLSGKAIAERLNGDSDTDWKCPNGCTRGNSVLIVGGVTYAKCYACGETNETCDPWIALYREHIKREDVPASAKLVATDGDGGVYAYTRGPTIGQGDGGDYWSPYTIGRKLYRVCRKRMDAMDWRDSLRRVADVWPEGGE